MSLTKSIKRLSTVSNKSLRQVTEKCLRQTSRRSTQSNSIWRTVSGCPQVPQVGWGGILYNRRRSHMITIITQAMIIWN